MFLPKQEIYEGLSSLGYFTLQGAQAVFADEEVPAITFRIDDNAVELDLDNEIASQTVQVVVDIWADDSVQASTMLQETEEVMRGINYRLEYSADVPQPQGCLYHITCRFIATKCS